MMSFFICFSQEDSIKTHFKTDETGLIWQKIFETDLTYDKIVNFVQDSGNFEAIIVDENKIKCELKEFDIDYKAVGGSYMSTPIYISRNRFTCFALIEYQHGKYRVTLKKFILHQNIDDPFARKGDTDPLDLYAIKKKTGEVKSGFISDANKYIDFTLNKLFTFKEKSETKW